MKKVRSVLILLFLAVGTAATDSQEPTQNKPGPPPELATIKLKPAPARPIRALQILSLEGKSWSEVDEKLKSFRQAGVNTIIFRVFHNQGDSFYGFSKPKNETGVYFKTSEAPVVDDILGSMCVLAHRNNLEIFAWMTTRYADYGIEDRADLVCWSYDLGMKKYTRAKGLSVFLPEVRARLVRMYKDLALYPIDGILLQDDLILRHNEDFHPRVQSIYKLSTGREAIPSRLYRGVHRNPRGRWVVEEYTEEFWLWARWKRDRLLEVTDEIRTAVIRERPGVKFGVNFYYETVTDPEHGLAWFSQELDTAARRYYDFYAIMLYHRQMQKELGLSGSGTEALVKQGVQYAVRAADDPARVLLKIQTVDWDSGTRIPVNELGRIFTHLKREPLAGWALIPAGESLDLNWVSRQYR